MLAAAAVAAKWSSSSSWSAGRAAAALHQSMRPRRGLSAGAKVWVDKNTRVICQGFTGKQVRACVRACVRNDDRDDDDDGNLCVWFRVKTLDLLARMGQFLCMATIIQFCGFKFIVATAYGVSLTDFFVSRLSLHIVFCFVWCVLCFSIFIYIYVNREPSTRRRRLTTAPTWSAA